MEPEKSKVGSSKMDPSRKIADKYRLNDPFWRDNISECPVFRPSIQDFYDPLVYLQRIAPEAVNYGKNLYHLKTKPPNFSFKNNKRGDSRMYIVSSSYIVDLGLKAEPRICKIIPPLNVSNPAGKVLKEERKRFKFSASVQPLRLAEWNADDKVTFLSRKRNYTIYEFEKMANKEFSRRYGSCGNLPTEFIENEFWQEMASGKKTSVEYGINVDGTAFSSDEKDQLGISKWNLKTLPHLPNSTLRLLKNPIPGITEPMLYIGMLFSMFAWHVEDHYLYSVNYHHCGAPKTWYGIPGFAALDFEKVVQDCVYKPEIFEKHGEDGAFHVLLEKTTMFPPSILLQHNVPVYKAFQMPGEFVFTFPRAYHAGFSNGFNCGEAVNFAIGDWFLLGAEATQRYARINKMPIIPYEKLVCKEAILLFKSITDEEALFLDWESCRFIKVSFVRLVRCHHHARWRLRKFLVLPLSVSGKNLGTVICSICKRDCYVAFISCKCLFQPFCVFHETEAFTCLCRGNHSLYLRKNISEIERVAQYFEQDPDVLVDVEQEMEYGGYPNTIKYTENGYTPYCQIRFSDDSGSGKFEASLSSTEEETGNVDLVAELRKNGDGAKVKGKRSHRPHKRRRTQPIAPRFVRLL